MQLIVRVEHPSQGNLVSQLALQSCDRRARLPGGQRDRKEMAAVRFLSFQLFD
jgi:hypothetical protein